MARRLLSLVQAVTQIGADPRDSDEARLRRAVGVSAVMFGGIPLSAGYGLLFLRFGEPFAGWVMLGASAAMALGLWPFVRTRDFGFFNVYWLLLTNASTFAASLSLGGFLRDGLFTFWGILVPMIAAVTNRQAHALAWFALFAAEVFATLALDAYLPQGNDLSPAELAAMSALNLLCFAALMLGVTLFFVFQQDALFRLARDERARSDALLLNILPRDIADRLRDRQQPLADRHADVSVLFADIVGFTPMSATMSPIRLVELLNEVFSYFDALVEEYGLEKIKTIGDCYMVAAGAPRPRDDHAQVLARMALRIQSEIRTRRFAGDVALSFRIGIHSGPVVAGVIGRKKFSYDLWGDVVNTASRMESHGSAGAIQITEATRDRIAGEFVCESRGSVEIKGKGVMPVWFVTGERAAAGLTGRR